MADLRREVERRARTLAALRRQREMESALRARVAARRGGGGLLGRLLEAVLGRAAVWQLAVAVRWVARRRRIARPRGGRAHWRAELALATARRRVAILEWRLRVRALPLRVRAALSPRDRLSWATALRAMRAAALAPARAAPPDAPPVTWLVHGTLHERLIHRVARRLTTRYPRLEIAEVAGWPQAVAAARERDDLVLVSRCAVGLRRDWLVRLVEALAARPDAAAAAPLAHAWGWALDGGAPRLVARDGAGTADALDGGCLLLRGGALRRPPPGYDTDLWAVDASLGWTAAGHPLLAVDAPVRVVAPDPRRELPRLLDRRGPALRRALAADPAPRSFTVRIAARDAGAARRTGDLQLATALTRALRRLGHEADVELSGDGGNAAAACRDVCVELRGRHRALQREGQLNVLWIISHPDDVTDAELEGADLVLVASRSHARALAARHRVPVRPLLQFTDPDRFFPEPASADRHEVLFVGNWRSQLRPAVWGALRSGRPLALYGDGWDLVAPRHARARWVEPDRLRRLYSSADVVLNDHWPDMRAHGFLSNRLFDCLACGAFVLSDDVPGLGAELDGTVATFAAADDVPAALDRWLAEPEARRRLAARGREIVRRRHTADARARELVALVEDVSARRADLPIEELT
ncbi:MAG TPA: glycosyltransferase [Solirubrobacteraceae bacterium]|nr:glycosyltransferase [Solirubrobacteraceae bacterium]